MASGHLACDWLDSADPRVAEAVCNLKCGEHACLGKISLCITLAGYEYHAPVRGTSNTLPAKRVTSLASFWSSNENSDQVYIMYIGHYIATSTPPVPVRVEKVVRVIASH